MPTPELIIRGALWKGAQVDLLVTKGKVVDLLPYDEKKNFEGARIVDADGLTLLPSMIDAHTHMRDPGYEYKEDIRSGLSAAAHGGFSHIMCMANTNPVNDNVTVTESMLKAAKSAWPRGPKLHPVGALTKGLDGKELAPMAELAKAGCAAFSNDGLPVADSQLFRHAMEYASDLGRVVIDHCEEPGMAEGVGVNESAMSGKLGLKGQPTVAEAMQVARDVLLAGYLDIPIHLAHISCIESIELIRWAKARGVRVTAETCPHYLVFTEEEVLEYNTSAKVNPPLRGKEHVQAMRAALSEGVIDMLSTDHAPHAMHEKETPFQDAPNGISGLDTALSLTWGLVQDKILDQDTLIRAWTTAPGKTFKLPFNNFNAGDPADFILFDTHASWEVTAEAMYSKGKNTPCMGRTLPGRVHAHYIGGKSII